MQACTTKAHWFRALLCGVAALQLGCHRDPSPVGQGLCTDDGIVSTRRSEQVGKSDISAEIVQTCGDCQHSVRPGAPPGSPCSAASVCREVCCECPNSFTKTYRARACDAASCAAGESACASARLTIRPDVCAP